MTTIDFLGNFELVNKDVTCTTRLIGQINMHYELIA